MTIRTVKIRNVTRVVPNIPSDSRWELSSLDHRFCRAYNSPKLIFYFKSQCNYLQNSRDNSIDDLMRDLRESLALTLDQYPIVAGRARINNEGTRLQIVRVPEDGVVFSEAVADASFDDWPDLRLCPLVMELNPDPEEDKSIEDIPLAKVQVTVFKCGGVALGFSTAHILTDGHSTVQFVRAWGETHQRKSLSITPVLSRTIISARDPTKYIRRATIDISKYDLLLPSILDPRKANTERNQAEFDHDLGLGSDRSHVDQSRQYQPHILMMRLSDKKVSECVKDVESGPFAYGPATSHEALCAVLWSSFVRAQLVSCSSNDEQAAAAEKISRFHFPLSIRRRCKFPIPEGYFGNSSLPCYVTDKAESIASHHISYVAKLIHDRIKSFDSEFIQTAIDWVDEQVSSYIRTPPLQFGKPSDIGGTTLAGFSFYDVDFGWGKPLQMTFSQIRPEFDPGPRCGMLIMGSPDGGGRRRDVCMGCPDEVILDGLLNDPVLLSYRDHENDIVIRPGAIQVS